LYGAGKRTGILAVESKLAKILGKSFEKPLTIIIRNKEDRFASAEAKHVADAFYSDLKVRLEAQGYRVKFQEDIKDKKEIVDLWADHSRDSDRLKFVQNLSYEELTGLKDRRTASQMGNRASDKKLPKKQFLLSAEEKVEISSFIARAPDTTLVVKAED
jgi:hypothetical protein